MAKKKAYPFTNLSWDDLREWAGSKTVSRGKSYQRRNLVSKLAVLENDGLLAWVDGTHRYATQVTIDEEGLPESTCTCPYGYDCKHGVATMQTQVFVRYPSRETFVACKKANVKTKTWPKVREHFLTYLEKGELPWKQKGWPLGKSNQAKPERSYRNTFPMTNVLIDIAILEKKPTRVLFWHDQLQKNNRGWIGVGDDRIAAAIQDYAPERAVAIWKTIAESLINQTKPSAYEQAASYLRKAEKIMKREKKQSEWKQYLNCLREKHARKRRFIEILGQSDSRPIISNKG